MKDALSALALGLCLAALSACGPHKPASQGANDLQVAVVDGTPIFASDVRTEALAQGLINPDDALATGSDTFHRMLEEVIDQKLLANEAVKRKLDQTPAAQKRLAAAHDRVLGDLMVDQLVKGAVSESRIQSLYAETAAQARRAEEVRLSQIVTPTGLESVAIRNAAERGESFESLALQRSTDAATKARGGDLGGYISLDRLPAAYAEAILKSGAVPGALVGPIQTQAGYVLLKVQDRRSEAPVSLASARPALVRVLTYDQVKELLLNLRGKAKLRITLPETAAPPAPAPSPVPAAPINPTPSSVKPGASSLPSSPAAK